jgi:PKD repeat protein/uncharacterized protein YraI
VKKVDSFNQSSTGTKVLIIVIVALAVCVLAALCVFLLGLLGVFPGLGDGQTEVGGGTVVVPTAAPGVPTVTANVNVNIRSGPGTQYPVIGILAQGQSAEVIGVSADGAWWAIQYPPGPNGQGWVADQFVTAQNTENVPVLPPPPVPTPTTAPPVVITDWKGEYFDNRELRGEPVVVRNDAEINFDWTGQSPAPGVPPENYSVRWTQSRDLPAGTYRFTFWVDDGVRLWVDGNLVIDGWQEGAIKNYVADVDVDQGTHEVRVEYFQAVGVAIIQLQIGYVEKPADGPPNAEISGPTKAQVGQPVVFSARNSSVAEGSHLTTFDWTFGDGTEANGVDVTHIYTEPGIYDVTLTVTDDKERSDTEVQQIEITGEPVPPEPEQPVAVINAPSEAEVGQPVPFDGSGSQPADSIVSYTWAFGDGTTADAIRVEKTYDAAGVFNATLIVTDDQGVQSQPATHQINILPETALPTLEPPEETPPPEPEPEDTPEPTDTPEAAEQPPTAAIAVSTDGVTELPIAGPVPAEVEQTLYFIGTGSQPGSSPIVSYEWAFGDGETATGEQVTHAFTTPGLYVVDLTVTDENGLTDMTGQGVQVGDIQPGQIGQ